MMLTWLLGAALRSLVLTIAVWLGAKALRIGNPHTQMAICRLLLIGMLAMPLVMPWSAHLLPAPPLELPGFLPDYLVGARPVAATPTLSGTAIPSLDWQGTALALYSLVAGLLGLRLLVGLARTWRLQRLAEPVRATWTEGRDVRVSPAISVPMTFGSTILLPENHGDWSPTKCLAVLAHEASHGA